MVLSGQWSSMRSKQWENNTTSRHNATGNTSCANWYVWVKFYCTVLEFGLWHKMISPFIWQNFPPFDGIIMYLSSEFGRVWLIWVLNKHQLLKPFPKNPVDKGFTDWGLKILRQPKPKTPPQVAKEEPSPKFQLFDERMGCMGTRKKMPWKTMGTLGFWSISYAYFICVAKYYSFQGKIYLL